eukprot:scaffold14035_cov172-Amphora_coffeaeformis.AAC.7
MSHMSSPQVCSTRPSFPEERSLSLIELLGAANVRTQVSLGRVLTTHQAHRRMNVVTAIQEALDLISEFPREEERGDETNQ